MKVVIVGTGNVAHVFGRLLTNAGYEISQVFGKNSSHAMRLAEELDSDFCSSWEDIDKHADVYLIAISDKALYDLDRQLRLSQQIIVHTAGSVPMNVLKNISPNHGVLYPLQSLKMGMPVMSGIPLLVDASNNETKSGILRIAHDISSDVAVTNDEQRLKFHVAAIFMNNFTNHLYTVAEAFCQNEGIQFSLLFPLAAETAKRLEIISPKQVLTGPAIRNDEVTIHKHLELLNKYPLLQTLYKQLTTNIQQFYDHSV